MGSTVTAETRFPMKVGDRRNRRELTDFWQSSREVYSQEFVANEVKKSWSLSYKIIFLVILHIQIEEFNYRLLIMLK